MRQTFVSRYIHDSTVRVIRLGNRAGLYVFFFKKLLMTWWRIDIVWHTEILSHRCFLTSLSRPISGGWTGYGIEFLSAFDIGLGENMHLSRIRFPKGFSFPLKSLKAPSFRNEPRQLPQAVSDSTTIPASTSLPPQSTPRFNFIKGRGRPKPAFHLQFYYP